MTANKLANGEGLDDFSEHHEVLYDTIQMAGEITARDLYDMYSEVMDYPRAHRMVRNYLSELSEADLISKNGATRGTTYEINNGV